MDTEVHISGNLPEICGRYGPYIHFSAENITCTPVYGPCMGFLEQDMIEELKKYNFDENSKISKWQYLQFPRINSSESRKEDI